jgi:hypothetical protein
MLIQVNYPDNSFDYVKDSQLHNLIESRKITRFRRSSGWVTVGVDPSRQFQRAPAAEPTESVQNFVRVAYDDKHFDYVSDKVLDKLLNSNKISMLKRVSGWVRVGVDPLRRAKREKTFKFPSELKKRGQ